ncbi:hypothetical protein [Prevotella sp. 885]|uniref:hypothetical protein n=1 Tax=Prevotella sp. 885 TaxID=2022527 RepID=UPI001140F7A9|nr:hypothetical protein [Prevotella sp. 885]
MIEPTKIRRGDIVATKRQSIIVERIESEGSTLAFYGKICRQKGRMPKQEEQHPQNHLPCRDLQGHKGERTS